MSPSSRRLTYALATGSGAAALVYQVVWMRSLQLVFGGATPATSAILFVFMGGLGLGAIWIGRRIDDHPSPLNLYARLEFLVAVAAGLSPLLLDLARAAYIGLGGASTLGGFGATAVRILLTAVVLGGPTFLLGATLPVLARALGEANDPERRFVGRLYALNTFGGVLGAFGASYVLMDWLGLTGSLLLAAGVTGLVGATAFILSRFVESRPKLAKTKDEVPAAPVDAPALSRTWVLGAAGLTGFVFFGLEVVWARMLAPILGGSTYTFGLIVALALAGIGLGAGRFQRRGSQRPITPETLAWTCALEGALILLPLALGDFIALLGLGLRGLEVMGFWGLVLGWVGVAGLVVLPPAIIAGFQFPTIVALRGHGEEDVGRDLGEVYAANTLGSILGALLMGFGLLQGLGAVGAWRLLAGLVLAFGLAVALHRPPRHLVAAGAGLLAALLLLSPGPTAVWRHTPIGAGLVTVREPDMNGIRNVLEERRRSVVWEAEGRESAVGLLRGDGYRWLIDGKVDGNFIHDAPTQVMLGLIGAALHPNPRESLVIGLGSGTSAGWLAAVPEMEHVEVIELEPAMLEVARMASVVNRNALDNPKVEVVIGDAREHMLTSRRQYDLIASEPSNPYRAGLGSLFTVEFYESARDRLRDSGLFLQWVQAYAIDAETVATIHRSLTEVFGNVEIWESRQHSDLVFVASTAALDHDLPRLEARLNAEPFLTAMSNTWGVTGVEGLYTGWVAGDRLMEHLPPGPLSTDDNLEVEYGFARTLGRQGLFDLEDFRNKLGRLDLGEPPVTGGALDWLRVRELRTSRALLEGGALPRNPDLQTDVGVRVNARRAWAEGRFQEILNSWNAQPQQADNLMDRLVIAEGLVDRGHPEARRYIAMIHTHMPVAARILDARLLARMGDPVQARNAVIDALTLAQSDPWCPRPLLVRGLSLALALARDDLTFASRIIELLGEPFAAGSADDDRLATRVLIAELSDFDALCLGPIKAYEPHVPWQEKLLNLRVNCYRVHDDPRLATAEADLAEFQSREPLRLLDAANQIAPE